MSTFSPPAPGGAVTSPAPARPHADPTQLLRLLTPRETQALALLAAGLDTGAIAEQLGISPGTARTHLHRAMRKLGVRTRAEATALTAAAPPAAPPADAPPATTAPTTATRPAHVAEAAAPPPAAEPRPETFEELCSLTHTRLVQQTFLLTACRHRAVHAVHLALSAAGRRWAEVGALPDPEGWVREYAFETAQAVWHRGGPRRAHLLRLPHRQIRVHPMPDVPSAPDQDRLTPRDRDLLKALGRLTRPQRRALVLHDALGLPAGQVAVEVQSSTAAATGRVLSARATLARTVPALVGADPADPGFGPGLGALLHQAAVRGCPAPRAPSARLLTARGRTRAGLAAAAAGAVTLAMTAAIVATLTGNGPGELFRSTELGPGQVCSTADSGSAGPAAPATDGVVRAGPGLRSHWCGPTPGQPVPFGPAPEAAPVAPAGATGATGAATAARPVGQGLGSAAAPVAPAPLPPLPVAVPAAPCSGLRLCPVPPGADAALRVELPDR
ncbi:sigma factor-like helix-turn-helix DNA-binding protein [Kitasatospora sp. NPDC101801]|uniref:sigma factor-like helix-turn-helix DNA-binding protein n=1 Tax=Kitasatospora sp. NPDC101801 TaxID=3364103 RepID=UPI00382E651C